MEHKIEKGHRTGFLTVVEIEPGVVKCVCDCGRVHSVSRSNYIRGNTRSCGKDECEFARLLRKERRMMHDLSKTRLYHIWNGMRGRCYRPGHYTYQNYGGRGITICDEWKNDFLEFRKWALSNGYSDILTIDRIDNNGNYEPSNCRWVTVSVQNANQRKRTKYEVTRRIFWEIDGVVKSRKDWCKDYGLEEQTVIYRVKVKGMSPKEALTTSLSSNGRKRK